MILHARVVCTDRFRFTGDYDSWAINRHPIRHAGYVFAPGAGGKSDYFAVGQWIQAAAAARYLDTWRRLR